MTDRYRTLDMWLGQITRAIARGDGPSAGILTRLYVQRCRELGVLGGARRAAPLEEQRPNDGEVPVTLPVVTRRWDRRGSWEP